MRTLFPLLIVIILIAAGAFAYQLYVSGDSGEPVACTMEAKLCPDGSSVGRVGPRCEFATCPGDIGSVPTPTPSKTTIETRIDQGASALSVKVVPLEVLQDSRCPEDAQCIWAGTVQVRALLSSGLGEAEQIFELRTPITTEAEVVTLVEVFPAPYAGRAILPSDYRFMFEVAKR